jgi:zinc protease
MNLLRRIISGLLFLAILASALHAADGPASVDEILERYHSAIGGKSAWEKLSTRSITAELEAIGLNTEWQLEAKAPNKRHTRVDLPGVGLFEDGFDGSVAWFKDGNGVRVKGGEEEARTKREAEFNSEIRLKDIYRDLAVKGTEKLDGEEVFSLESKPAASSKERFFFSKKSGLLLRHLSEFENADGTRAGIDRRLGDHKEVGGINYPHLWKIQMIVDGQEAFAFSIKVKEIKHNEKIDEKKFSKPAA